MWMVVDKLTADELYSRGYRNAVFVPEEDYAKLEQENQRLGYLLGQIITDLPSNRDWLNPDIEREAKQALKEVSDE